MKADILALVEVFGDSEVMVAQLKKEQTTQVRKAKDFTAKVNKKIEDGEEPWTFWQLHAEAEWAGEFGMWFGDLAKTLSEKVETCCARSINRLDL